MKKILIWLFKDFLYQLNDMMEAKFTLSIGSIDIVKSFLPSSIGIGGVSKLKLSVRSDSTDIANFTDTFPIGMEVANPPNLVNPFPTGLVNGGSAGDTSIVVAPLFANIVPNTTVHFIVDVTVPIGNPLGDYVNDNVVGALNFTPATLTIIAQKNKKRRGVAVPPTFCLDQTNFRNGVSPSQVIHRGFYYDKIGKSNCYVLRRR